MVIHDSDDSGALRSGHPRFYEMTQEEIELHDRKNHDYARGGDPLGNFYRVGKILALYLNLNPSDPRIVAMTYALKQLDAVLWMISGGYEGDVEGIDDRLRDVHVYMKLARILNEELNNAN